MYEINCDPGLVLAGAPAQGLLTAQTLNDNLYPHTLDIVQDGDQVTATDILDNNLPRYSGDKWGQVLIRDWGQVKIPQPHREHRVKQSMMSQAGGTGDLRQITENRASFESASQILNHSSIKNTSGFWKNNQ